MSAKTSPSSTSRDANVGSSSAIPVQIKKELPSDEIKVSECMNEHIEILSCRLINCPCLRIISPRIQ